MKRSVRDVETLTLRAGDAICELVRVWLNIAFDIIAIWLFWRLLTRKVTVSGKWNIALILFLMFLYSSYEMYYIMYFEFDIWYLTKWNTHRKKNIRSAGNLRINLKKNLDISVSLPALSWLRQRCIPGLKSHAF